MFNARATADLCIRWFMTTTVSLSPTCTVTIVNQNGSSFVSTILPFVRPRYRPAFLTIQRVVAISSDRPLGQTGSWLDLTESDNEEASRDDSSITSGLGS